VDLFVPMLKMKKSTLIFIFICFVFTASKAQALTDIETVRSRFYAEYLSASHSTATSTRTSQDASGKWQDLDYVKDFPTAHLDRLLKMAASYQSSKNAEYQSPAMLEAISRGLDFWFKSKKGLSSNWWVMDIGQQIPLQKILILMQGFISNDLILTGTTYLSTMRPTSRWVEGQNLVWIMGQKLHRGVLLRDSADMRSALDSIQMQLEIVKYSGKIQKGDGSFGVGIQEDYSFFQHGAQFYNCGYGRTFLQDQISYAMMVRGTCFALTPQRLDVLSNYFLTTCKLYRNSLFHDPAEGRGIAIDGGTKNYMVPLLTMISILNPQKKSECQALLDHFAGTGASSSFQGNTYFWNGDFMVQQRNAYYASVRMCSDRTVGTESFSGDNRNGYWNPFGIQFITRNGTEYSSIFPLWKWSHVPGVTCPDTVPRFTAQNQSQTEKFVGGVSDGKYGMSVLTMNKFNTKAKKAWFFFDKEIVALGTGIASTAKQEVNTTLNQCYLVGDVMVDGKVLESGSESKLQNIKWVLHDKIGYVFPDKYDISIRNMEETGSWSDIGQGSDKKFTSGVFSLWLSHGVKPTNESYQYIIVPDIEKNELVKYVSKLPVQFIQNDSNLQAVRHNELGITQIAFYQKGKVTTKLYTVDVDQPCLLMIKETKSGLSISASNPDWSNKMLNVNIMRKNAAEKSSISFTFTSSSAGGATQTKMLDLK